MQGFCVWESGVLRRRAAFDPADRDAPAQGEPPDLFQLREDRAGASEGKSAKEQFQFFWQHISPAWAGKFLDQWTQRALRSRIEPLKGFARSLRRHRELLLNYFRARKRFSAGVVEGLNNKAKTTMKNAYGFRTYECLEIALYHALGDLPEPQLTHRFL